MRSLIHLLPILLLSITASAAEPTVPQRPFTVQDLVSLKRLSSPEASPDGHHLAYVLRETDLAADAGRSDVWVLDLDRPTVPPRRMTQHAANDTSPHFSPDGGTLYFLSTRSGSSQVWRMALAGGEPTQVTDYPLDVGTFKVSPQGDRLAMTLEVMPGCAELACSRSKLDERKQSKATGRSYDRLFVRHWDTWSEGTRSNLFVATLLNGTGGTPVNLTGSLDADIPSKPFGGEEEFSFAPDGTQIVFSARVAGREESWSTNFDLYQVAVNGSGKPQNLTSANLAWDTQPVFLKNGDLAYLAMARPGFESDRFEIMLRDARSGTARAVAHSWDRSVAHLGVSTDGRTLLALADDLGQATLFAVDPAHGTPRRLTSSGQVSEFTAARNTVVVALASLAAPADLYAVRGAGSSPPVRLTAVNAETLGARAMSSFEQFSFKGADDATVYGYVMQPFGYRKGQRYPLAMLIHGGPEVAFGNSWAYRWNAQTFAGHGYGVVFIDFHGTPGYGQAFTDSIAKDWGGRPLQDLKLGLAAATQRYGWLDAERACALGASYGGFMVNWIAGAWPERFRCLVNHDGIFDQRMMYYSTEELWFPEWENGAPYYEDPAPYERFNPANLVKQWRSPMLVIHGEQDFRIPYDQGLATFSALQRRGIESKLLIFPNENHWVQKPANSIQWYSAVLEWLDAHTR